MNDKEKEIRIKKALDYHKKGYKLCPVRSLFLL